MARIQIHRRECDGEHFPRLCMRCGQPADHDVPQRFAWSPSWVFVFLLFGLLPLLIAVLLTRKTMHVVAPMCQDHTGHWRVRKMYLWLGLLFWIMCAVVLGVLADSLPADTVGPLVLGGLFCALIWLVSVAVVASRAIKPAVIRDKDIELVNVHRDFADAWNDADDWDD